MVKYLFVLISCFVVLHKMNSQNIVTNSSFEEFIDFSKSDILNWHKVQESDTPDYFNFGEVTPNNNIYNKYMGNIEPKSGDGFVGIFCYRKSTVRGIKNIREFIEAPLKQALEKDSLYKIELSIRLDIESNLALKNFGVLFPEITCTAIKKFNPFLIKPQVAFDTVLLDSTSSWMTLKSYYKADGTEKNIVIGNFSSDTKTQKKKVFYRKEKGKRYKWDLLEKEQASYYYVDDISVEKVPVIQKQPIEEDTVVIEQDTIYNINKLEVDSAIILRNINFEFNKSELLPASYQELKKLEKLLQDNPTVRIMLEGHTDNVGGYEFNLKLSNDRVKSVVSYLVGQGIDASRLEYAGYSYSKPLAPNSTEEGRKKNRRVVFKIISK